MIKAHIPGTLPKLGGVIYIVSLERTEEEVKKEIRGGKVINVKRLGTNRSGVKKDSILMVQSDTDFEQTSSRNQNEMN